MSVPYPTHGRFAPTTNRVNGSIGKNDDGAKADDD